MALTTTENTATISTTEYFLASNSTTQTPQTTQCYLQVWIDTSAMQAGDEYRVRVYEKIAAGGNQYPIIDTYLAGPQAEPWVSPALHVRHGWEVSLQRTAGSDRSFTWSLRRAD